MAGPLDLRGRVTITNGASGTLGAVQRQLHAIGSMSGKAGKQVNSVLSGSARGGPAGSLGFGMTAFGFGALIGATKEWNDAIWGTNAALLAGEEAQKRVAAGDMPGALNLAKKQTEVMRDEAMRLSRELNLLPELFAKAGMEATKMGLDYKQSQAVMRAAGAVFMSDKDAEADTIAKALGTYGIIYGQEKDPDAYAKQVYQRASALAFAGAKTRTSASAIEEGSRNFMGLHGAFGGHFEDLIALIAAGSQVGQFEKVTGTSLKQLQARFLRMPASGYGAMAGAGIDLKKFMDFGAVDPMRATNNIIQSFPQQLGKGARGNIFKFLEKAQREGRLQDPGIIGETMTELEKNGLKFAGDEDRDSGFNKLAAIMSGVGGKFDIIGLFSEATKAIEAGKAGPGIMGLIGDPKRIHEYLAVMKVFPDLQKLRDDIKGDAGNYLKAIEMGFKGSDAGKVADLLAAFQRLQIALMTNDGFRMMVGGLASVFEWMSKLPPEVVAVGMGLVGLRAGFAAIGWLFGGLIAQGGRLLAIFAGIRAMLPGGAAAAAAGAGLFSMGNAAKGVAAGAAAAAASKKIAGLGAATASGRMIAGMSGAGVAAAGAGAGAMGAMGMFGKAGSWLWGGAKGVLSRWWPLMMMGAGYGAADEYYNGGSWSEILKRAGKGAFGLDLGLFGGDAKADDSAPDGESLPPVEVDQGAESGTGTPGLDIAANGQAAIADAQSIAQQIQQIFASIDLASAGQQMMASLAAGIQAGGAQAVAAANSVASQVQAAGARVNLNTGPNMQPAR